MASIDKKIIIGEFYLKTTGLILLSMLDFFFGAGADSFETVPVFSFSVTFRKNRNHKFFVPIFNLYLRISQGPNQTGALCVL